MRFFKKIFKSFKKQTLELFMTVDSDFEGHIGFYRVDILNIDNRFFVIYFQNSFNGFYKVFNRFENGTLGYFNSLEEAKAEVNNKLGCGYFSILNNFVYLTQKMMPINSEKFKTTCNIWADKLKYKFNL